MNLGTPGHGFEAKSDLLVASLEQAGAAVKRCTGLSETPETIERLPERVERVSLLARLADEVSSVLEAVQCHRFARCRFSETEINEQSRGGVSRSRRLDRMTQVAQRGGRRTLSQSGVPSIVQNR